MILYSLRALVTSYRERRFRKGFSIRIVLKRAPCPHIDTAVDIASMDCDYEQNLDERCRLTAGSSKTCRFNRVGKATPAGAYNGQVEMLL